MNKKIFQSEEGFASIYGVFVLSMLMLLGAALFEYVHSEYQTSRNFVMAEQLRVLAENGILIGAEKCSNDRDVKEKIMRSRTDGTVIHHCQDERTHLECNVYAVYKNDMILLMAVSSDGKRKNRTIGKMRQVNGKYVLDHWER